jgi:Ser/Thr protein kinase RdoA (MazF antagonist)
MSLAIQSELVWLEALAAETGLPLQQPQRTRDGDLLAHVELQDGERVPATLLTWLDGAPFQLAAPNAPALVTELGRLLARLHLHTEGWQTPPAFVRPHYETAYLAHIAQELLGGVFSGLVTQADYLACERSLAALSDLLDRLPRHPPHWGLIHNDLHPGNCLVLGGQVLPIDFSQSGFGCYLFDIGMTLSSLPANFRAGMLAGYRSLRPLPEDGLRLVEGSLIASRLSYYAFHLHDPTQHDWLRGRLARLAAEICRPFLAGEGFLLHVR